MRRIVVFVVAVLALAAWFAVPASAHVQVTENGKGSGWVGSPALPGKGKGLVPGGPTGEIMQSPSHAKGLNTACEALKSHGNAAVQIFGPPTPNGCPHGT